MAGLRSVGALRIPRVMGELEVMRDEQSLLTWRRTWDDTPNDGVGTHPDWPDLKARVYQEPGGTRWAWFVSEVYFIDRGIEASKEAAKQAAEDAAWMERR